MSLPLPLSSKPRKFARQSTAATYPAEQAEQAVRDLAAVRKVLDDKDTPECISIDELLLKVGVS